MDSAAGMVNRDHDHAETEAPRSPSNSRYILSIAVERMRDGVCEVTTRSLAEDIRLNIGWKFSRPLAKKFVLFPLWN